MRPSLESTPNKLIQWILSFACCWKFLMKLFWMEVSYGWMTEEGKVCCIASRQQMCTSVMRSLMRESPHNREETKELVQG